MATKRQIEANRRNARKSTGPNSPEGKAASSMNALKTGLYAESEVLPWESREAYQQLIARFYADHRPATALACQYVDEMVYCTWNLRRLRRAEAQALEFVHQDCHEPSDEYPLGQACSEKPKVFSALQWRMDANRRALDKAYRFLREVQANERADTERGAVPAQPHFTSVAQPGPPSVTETIQAVSAEIGFVPSSPSGLCISPHGPTPPITLRPVFAEPDPVIP